jgi:hypothetical protein
MHVMYYANVYILEKIIGVSEIIPSQRLSQNITMAPAGSRSTFCIPLTYRVLSVLDFMAV